MKTGHATIKCDCLIFAVVPGVVIFDTLQAYD